MNHSTINILMRSHGLEPSTLAARANIRTEAMGAILAGTKTPNLRESRGLASVFNLALSDFAELPAPGLDAMPEWQALRENLFQHGQRYGWGQVAAYLVVMGHALGREVAQLRMRERA